MSVLKGGALAWLGHSSIAITGDTYGHLYAGHEEEIVKGLDAAYEAAEVSAAALGSVAELAS